MQESPWRQLKELLPCRPLLTQLCLKLSVYHINRYRNKFGRDDYKASRLGLQNDWSWGDLTIQREFLSLIFKSHMFLDASFMSVWPSWRKLNLETFTPTLLL